MLGLGKAARLAGGKNDSVHVMSLSCIFQVTSPMGQKKLSSGTAIVYYFNINSQDYFFFNFNRVLFLFIMYIQCFSPNILF